MLPLFAFPFAHGADSAKVRYVIAVLRPVFCLAPLLVILCGCGDAAKRADLVFINSAEIETPDPAMDLLLNRWLLYQVVSCRLWGRSAFYQSGGAYGFRDQLQDVMALVYSAPAQARAHILRAELVNRLVIDFLTEAR